MQSLLDKVVSRVYGHGRGWTFTPSDFRDLSEPRAIGGALSQLQRRGTIRLLGRGRFEYPKTHPVLGVLNPAPESVARAIAGKAAVRLQPSGAYAANLLGLSEQVPARITFYTEGPSKKVRVGSQTIELKRTAPRNMATAGRISGLVIQALRHLGAEHVDRKTIDMLRRKLDSQAKDQLIDDIAYAPAWIGEHLRAIVASE